MNNQWLDDLRRKMEDHTEDVHDELWNDIRDELFSEDEKNDVVGLDLGNDVERKEKSGSGSPKSSSKKIFYRIAGMAAAIALFFIVGRQLIETYQEEKSSQKAIFSAETQEKTSDYQKSSAVVKKEESDGIPEKKNDIKILGILNRNTFTAIIGREINEVFGTDHNTEIKNQKIYKLKDLLNQDEQIVQGQNMIIDHNPAIYEKGNEEIFYSKNEKELTDSYEDPSKSKIAKRQSDKLWTLSALTGNASPNSAEQFPGYATLSGRPMSVEEVWHSSAYEENPLTEVLLANQNQPVEAKIRHRMPVTFGLSLYHSLGKRWGIGAGVNYTKLSSDLHSGSNANFIKSVQTVHYIGIPVQVNYNVIQKGAFTGYITGGALIEKPISGSIKTKYVVNDMVKDETNEKLETKPVQVSLNSAVGLQLKVVNKIGIYAEPGIGYHFKDNSSLNTIYKEKPLNFNVKFGIRLQID